MIPFGDRYETTVFIMAATILASLPDIYLSLQRQGYPIHHRGPTHSLLFALLCGVALGGILFYLYKTWIYSLIGFFVGGNWYIVSPCGDMLTFIAFMPLWPFSDKKIRFGLVGAANQDANTAMFFLGLIYFAAYAST